jgi:hypothetical protein
MAIAETVKAAFGKQVMDKLLEKAIREEVNTIRLHAKDVRMREQRQLQLSN